MVVMKKYCNKFTLVEILAVVALIGILTAIGFGAYTYAMNSAKESSTKALIKRLESGLESCRTKFGYFPATCTTGNQPQRRFMALKFEQNNDGEIDNIIVALVNNNGNISSTPFFTFPTEMRQEFLKVVEAETLKKSLERGGSNQEVLIDGWGGVIYYAYPGFINETGFDLVSAGPNGRFGNTSGGSATPETVRDRYYDTSTNEKNCDDITNF